MNLTPPLEKLVADGTPSPETIDRFIADHAPFPITDGPSTTFVFRGDAQSVHWQHWIFGLATSQEFHRLEGTDLWYLCLFDA